MKKIILAAAFIIAISGFAAAQSTSTKQVTRQGKEKAVKKSATAKNNSKTTALKQESLATAKSDSPLN